MKFVMNRTRTIASVMGLAIEFEKNVPTFVPPYMYQEVIAAGGVSENELTDEELKSGNPNEPFDSAERKAALMTAFEQIVLRNIREEFTAGGTPHNAVMAKELGWPVPAKERDIAWTEFKADKAD